MREGSGEAMVAISCATAFDYLADPRNAPEWFAGVTFPEPPEGAPQAGMTWRFVQARSDQRIVPVRMEVYEPPRRFVWRTALRWPRTNLRWEMRCDPDLSPNPSLQDAGASSAWRGLRGSRLAHQPPAQGGEPEQTDSQDGDGTRLRMTIAIEPGPAGWLGLYLSPRSYRPNPALQAQRAVERARDALLALEAASSDATKPAPKRDRRRR